VFVITEFIITEFHCNLVFKKTDKVLNFFLNVFPSFFVDKTILYLGLINFLDEKINFYEIASRKENLLEKFFKKRLNIKNFFLFVNIKQLSILFDIDFLPNFKRRERGLLNRRFFKLRVVIH